MSMMLGEILRTKGAQVVTTKPDAGIREAITLMVECKVGSALVLDPDGALAGIVTERDILWALAQWPDGLVTVRVADVMTPRVVTAAPTDTVEDVMALMTLRRFRHVPVMEGGRLVGVISIGDLVKAQVEAAHHAIRHLEDYITGKYPG